MNFNVSDVQADYVRFRSRLAWAFFTTPTGWSLAPFLPVYFLLPKKRLVVRYRSVTLFSKIRTLQSLLRIIL